MKLRNIQLQGFKTFGAKTRVEFSPGLTAIVGPNGSGKSNLADAVAWVLGEQALSALRVRQSRELIYQPLEEGGVSNMVEVQISIEDKDGILPLEGIEFDINRIGFRDGESEYRLNGHRTRLNQIREILAPYGMAKRTFSLIRQGQCDQFLNVNSIQRRRIVEEAAGALGVIHKKQSAVRRLSRISDHLGPVHQELRDLNLSLSHLERQARQFERRKQYIDALREAATRFYPLSVKIAQADLDRITGELTQVRRQQEEAEISFQEQRLEASILQERLESLEKQLKKLQSKLSSTEKHMNDLQRIQVVFHERERNLTVSRAQNHERLHAALKEQSKSSHKLNQQNRIKSEVKASIANLQQELECLNTKEKELQEAKKFHRGVLTSIDAEWKKLAGSKDRLLGEKSMLEWQAEQEGGNSKRLLHELREAKGVLRQLAESIADSETKIAKSTEVRKSLNDEMAELHGEGFEARRTLNVSQQLETQLRSRQSECKAKQDYLSGILSQNDAPFADLPGMDKSLGQLATLLQVETENQAGVNASLGEWQYSYVFRTWSEALQVWEAAHKEKVPSDLRLAVLQDIPDQIPVRMADSNLLQAIQDVKGPRAIRLLLSHILSNSVLAQNAQEALSQFAPNHREETSFVATTRGDLLAKPGLVRIRGTGSGRKGLLNVASDIQDLKTEGGTLSLRILETQKEVKDAELRLEDLEVQKKGIQSAMQEVDFELHSRQQEISLEIRSRDSISKDIEALENSRREGDRKYLERSARITEIESLLNEIEPRKRVFAEKSKFHQGALEQLELNSHLGRLSELRDVKNSLLQDLNSARIMRVQENERAVEISKSIGQLEAESNGMDADQIKLDGEMDANADAMATTATQVQALQAKISPLILSKEQFERKRSTQSEAFAQEREIHLELETRRLNLELQHSEKKENCRRLQHSLMQDLELLEDQTVTDTEAASFLLSSQVSSAENPVDAIELDRLRQEIHRCGQVDINLYISYQSAQERSSLLVAQTSDMVDSELELRKIIERLDNELDTITQDAFAHINKGFGTYFERFFPGGKGWLELQPKNGESEQGVELHVQLADHQPQAITALSGGEKALAAIAFLFSLLSYNRPPFCVLDEIDAALDDSNVGRVGLTIRELALHTQFILITHNQAMLEYADSIFGVTKNAEGTSQLLSMKLHNSTSV